jgi:hypothetical protein
MRTAVQDTSIDAFYSIVGKSKSQADRLCAIVLSFCAGGSGADLSMQEIKKIHQQLHGDIELSTVSARINSLITAKRLARRSTTRKCSVTGVLIHPVSAPFGQGELFN